MFPSPNSSNGNSPPHSPKLKKGDGGENNITPEILKMILSNFPQQSKSLHHDDFNTPAMLKNFTVSGNERKLEDVLSRLRFGSKINAGWKANVEKRIVREPGYATSLIRTFGFLFGMDENRKKTLDFYKKTAHDTFELLYFYTTENEDGDNPDQRFKTNIIGIIIKNLVEFRKSLIEMCATYKDDRGFISDVEALIFTLDAKIKAYAK